MQNAKLQFKVQNLRKKYPKFVYKSYSYKISSNNLKIFFNFQIEPSVQFNPQITIENIDKSRIKRVGDKALNNLIFHLGLMEIPSYWKTTCSPEIVIKAGSLNSEQIKWWKDLMMKGLGQFFFENKINFRKPNFLKIKTLLIRPNRAIAEFGRIHSKKILVPVGGGKDSAVTLELLKKAKKDIQCFSLNPTEAAKNIMRIGGCKKPIIVRRKIDKKLLELNRQGFLNGHTPFSAYLAFLSVLAAAIFGYKYVALSNERSSNEGNVKYSGEIINHQWSKSFDFEQKFRKYSKKYLAKDIEYFSFLRPLYEIQIAKLFSKYRKYFSVFLSCNEAYKTASGTKKPTRKWCGNCPKCLFNFTILFPFVDEEKLIKIFGKNLFDNKDLLTTMLQLIEGEKFKPRMTTSTRSAKLSRQSRDVEAALRGKPFECVGTVKESLVALYLSWKKNRGRTSVRLPFLLSYFEDKILPKYSRLEKESKKIMNSWDKQNNLSKELEKILKKEVSKKG